MGPAMDKLIYIGCTLTLTVYGQLIVKAASIRRAAHVSQAPRPRADRGGVTINALAQ
jgi:hypothetical protein